MTDEQKLVELVTRGLAGIQEQLREREGRVSQLSEKMVGVEFQLAQLNKTLGKLESDMSAAQISVVVTRVATLEELAKESKQRQQDNAKWIKGLIASVIILLLGVLFNFIRIGLKQ
jgi:chromosome segregation ATPase